LLRLVEQDKGGQVGDKGGRHDEREQHPHRHSEHAGWKRRGVAAAIGECGRELSALDQPELNGTRDDEQRREDCSAGKRCDQEQGDSGPRPVDVVQGQHDAEDGHSDRGPSQPAKGNVAGDELGEHRQGPEQEGVQGAGSQIGRQLVQVTHGQVGQREREIGQCEHHRHAREVEPAERIDIGEDDVHLGELDDSDARAAEHIERERPPVRHL
jgi:hypothetical protein